MTQGLFVLMALIMFLDINTFYFLRDELKILSKLQAFAGNPLCGSVCTNCFEKCTYFFASITVRMIREMHQRIQTMYFLSLYCVILDSQPQMLTVKKKIIILFTMNFSSLCQLLSILYRNVQRSSGKKSFRF